MFQKEDIVQRLVKPANTCNKEILHWNTNVIVQMTPEAAGSVGDMLF
jgi:hypothetical protein